MDTDIKIKRHFFKSKTDLGDTCKIIIFETEHAVIIEKLLLSKIKMNDPNIFILKTFKKSHLYKEKIILKKDTLFKINNIIQQPF